MAGDTMRRLAAACWLERARERPGQLAAGPASQQRAPQASSMRTNYKNPHPALWARLLVILFLATHSSQPNSNKQVRALETSASDGAAARLADQLVGRLPSADAISQAGAQFDGAKFSSLHEALRAHPDLSQFAQLCELRGVTKIVAMDTPLTVFAPVDRALADLLKAGNARHLSLAELAKHHIAQGALLADSIDKFPHQFQSYSQCSPLYLNRLADGRLLVNNAKILATYVIQVEADFQVLHVIDRPLEFACISRRAPMQTLGPAAAAGGAAAPSAGADARSLTATIKRPLDLAFLAGQEAGEQAELAQTAIGEFVERFADLSSGQPEVELYSARGRTPAAAAGALQLAAAKWAKLIRADQERERSLKGKLYQTDSLNTYFLPVDSDELEQLLEGADIGAAIATIGAHVIAGQVLFTRAMPLGQLRASSAGVSLSLAKTLPDQLLGPGQGGPPAADLEPAELSRRLLGSPLLLQATAAAAGSADGAHHFRPGVTSAEILAANIPLANGVLHLIKRPLLVPASSLLDFINDNERQLGDFVQAAGSQTGRVPAGRLELNRFRELLARGDRQLLATFSKLDRANSNRTILAPSDEAFARLRYDLRALISNDELLIPSHWDASYRQVQLERILKRHLIDGQTLSSQELAGGGALASTLNNFQLSFSLRPAARANGPQTIQVQCDSSQANLVHLDLLANNGVLHLIDRVLGEELETVHSLLRSIVLRFAGRYAQLASEGLQASPMGELAQLVEANLKSGQPALQNDLQPDQQQQQQQLDNSVANNSGGELAVARRSSPELQIVSKSIEQFLGELSAEKRQLLAASVNITFELARLGSRAENRDDWNAKFKLQDKSFTYFAPTDLAWLRLAQLQPELYKPLVYFLGQQQQPAGQPAGPAGEQAERPQASESSHRLIQLLERHLIGNRRLAARDLDQLETIHSIGGATLRLVAQQMDNMPGETQASSFVALHPVRRTLRLGQQQANIVQAHESSNGFVYLIDQVLTAPDDAELLVQTSSTPAISGTMSSLLGAHNSAILDAIQGLFASNGITSASTMITLIGALLLAIVLLTGLLLFLVVRRRRQTKLNRHRQLESGLTSSSSANSGSTSTTKSL